MNGLTLHLYQPLPSSGDAQVVDLNPQITSLRVSTKLPGGFNTLQAGWTDVGGGPRMWLPEPVNARLFSHVELRAGFHVLFQGQVMLRQRPGGFVTGIQAEGYGVSALADDAYESTDTTSRTSGACLLIILGQCAPLIRVPGDALHFVDPGVTGHTLADFTDMTPADVVNRLVREGGSGNAPWDWAVWEDQTAFFLPRMVPDVATYQVPWDAEQVQQWDEDAHQMYGSVFMKYTPPGGSASYTTTTSTSAFTVNYNRYRRILLKGATMPATSAQQFQETYRVKYAQPVVAAKLLVSDDFPLRTPGGQAVPTAFARAGEWVQVGDADPQIVIQTDYDAFQGTNTLTLGAYPRDWFNALTEAQAVATSVVQQVNPVTGAQI